MHAKLHKNKVVIFDLYPFVLVVSKNSRLIRRITRTSVFIESLVARDIVIPVPIAK